MLNGSGSRVIQLVLAGCVSNRDGREGVLALGEEALGFHAEGTRKDGEVVPMPCAVAGGMADPGLAE